MNGSVTDEALATLFNMPENALEELHRILDGPCALELAHLAPFERRSVQTVRSHTHLGMKQQPDVVQTHNGPRPRDPFADIIFSYVWATVSHKLQSFMRDQGLISAFPKLPKLQLFRHMDADIQCTEEFLSPTWMDDLAVCVQGDSPDQVAHNIGIVTGRLLELCMEHCMTPSLSRNKTEILLSLRGKQSRKQKMKFLGPAASGVMPIISEYGVFEVPLTTSYCHLGGLLQHAGDQREEIRRRLGIAWSTIASCCSAIGPFLWTNGVSSLNRWYSASSFTEQRPGL